MQQEITTTYLEMLAPEQLQTRISRHDIELISGNELELKRAYYRVSMQQLLPPEKVQNVCVLENWILEATPQG